MTRTVLDSNLKQAVAVGTPIEVVDPATNDMYYLLSAEQFCLLLTSNAGDIYPRHVYRFVDLTMADDDANDPLLGSYQ